MALVTGAIDPWAACWISSKLRPGWVTLAAAGESR
jgi:hypothetical protein